jgi:hypothetical protein
MKKHLLICTLVFPLASAPFAHAGANEKGSATPMSHLPQNLKEPPPAQEATPPVPTSHFDPSLLKPDAAKPMPATVEPIKIPGSRRSADPSALPDAAPTGPGVSGFQTPDHLIDGVHRQNNLPGDAARYERAVKELFGDAGSIRDLPGMTGSEVDPMSLVGDSGEDALGKYNDALGGQSGLDEAGFMPAPTTPGQSPANAGSGPGRAPLGPKGPRESMAGAAAWPWDNDTVVVRLPSTVHPPKENDGSKYSHTEHNGTTRYADRSETTYTHRRTDDSYSRQDVTTYQDGRVTSRMRHYGADGYHNPQTDDSTVETQPGRDGGLDELPTTEGSGDAALAFWHYQHLYHGRKDTGIQSPNQGPPPGGEDGAAGAPPTTDFNLGDDIVINPDPARAAGAGGPPPRALDARSQIEKDKTPGGYTPP